MISFKHILYFILIFSVLPDISGQGSNNEWAGTWIRTEPDTIILEISEPVSDSFEFKMTSYHPGFAGYIGRDDYSSPKYAHIKENLAHFDDEGAISDGRPLYYEGEKPCELFFDYECDSIIVVKERNCLGIYGGSGIIWEGEYKIKEMSTN